MFKVTYVRIGKVNEKSFADVDEAVAAYEKLAAVDKRLPRKLESIDGRGTTVVLMEDNWYASKSGRRAEEELTWRNNATQAMFECGIRGDRIESLLNLGQKKLKDAVRSNDIDFFMSVKGIGEVTARKVCVALWPFTRNYNSCVSGSYEFIRMKMVHPDESGNCWAQDTIRKNVSNVEREALRVGGPDAIIEVVSLLPDKLKGEDNKAFKDTINVCLDSWHKCVYNHGMIVNEKPYTFLGHGTNAAKECKTLWVLEEIFDHMKEFLRVGKQPDWETTTAKALAYSVGLQAVATKATGIPFQPEDFEFFASVVTPAKGKFVKIDAQGNRTEMPDEYEDMTIRSDGYFCIDIDAEMKPVFVQRMVEKGIPEVVAKERINAFMADHGTCSYRINGVAFKGCGSKRFKAHEFLKDNGITHTPSGKPLNKVSVFCDETTLKTKIGGKGAAYKTFEEWANAVRERMSLGVCVGAHEKMPKHIPYQVVQALTEASEDDIKELAQPAVNVIADMVNEATRYKYLDGEVAHIAEIFPEFTRGMFSVKATKDKVESIKNEAFGGKIINSSNYTMLLPDEVLVFQGWFGLETTGCLDAGQINEPTSPMGETVFWRNPIMHPSGVCLMENVDVKSEYRKYFKENTFDIMINGKDSTTTKVAADFDGDHGSTSQLKALINALKKSLKRWNYTVIWDGVKAQKGIIKRDDELKHVFGLVRRNELGLTIYQLNALLNRIYVDPKTKARSVRPIEEKGVDFACFAGNVLVDAGKHGGLEIVKPYEFKQAAQMLQPLAFQWRRTEQCEDEKERKEKREMLIRDGRECVPAGTLDKLFKVYAKELADAACELEVKNDFDFTKLMFNSEKGYRGLDGLIKEGKQSVVKVDGESLRPDQGCFDALCHRLAMMKRPEVTEERKDKADKEFMKDFRIIALKEIEDFAAARGRTLEDAYDVITYTMFAKKQELNQKTETWFLNNRLWNGYWAIFGGMAERAAMRYEV